jgi:tRNA pseudouridine38-40 synthase
MPRYALMIDYDGGPFAGWQRQSHQPSVQGAVEAALSRLTPGEYVVTGAGRTDAGVHATGQVAHVDIARDWDVLRLTGAINAHLRPLPVAVLQVAQVADDFHARLTHDRGRIWQVGHGLDLAAMQAAAAHLVGKHDFTTFRSAVCQAQSPVKTLDAIVITERPIPGGIEYRFALRARSFLHNQVRSIVGTLERVGAGAWSPEDVRAALAARDRQACGPVSPPQGLYLTGVGYPVDPFADA